MHFQDLIQPLKVGTKKSALNEMKSDVANNVLKKFGLIHFNDEDFSNCDLLYLRILKNLAKLVMKVDKK